MSVLDITPDRTPGELLNIFRYPSATERELARAGEIYIRTLELVEAKVREGGRYNLSSFSPASRMKMTTELVARPRSDMQI